MADQTTQKQKKSGSHKILFKPVIGPILGSAAAIILSEFIIGAMLGLAAAIAFNLEEEAAQLVLPWFAAFGGIFTLFLYKLWFKGEFKGCCSGSWGDTRTKVLILIMAALNLALIIFGYVSSGIHTPTLAILGGALMAGICEEVSFRLVPVSLAMHKAESKKNIYTALIISTVMFGLVHASNLMTGQSMAGTVIQVVATLGMGMFFGAIYLRTGNLLITIIYHTAYDFLVMLQAAAQGMTVDLGGNSIAALMPQLVIAVIFAVLAVVMLKGNTDSILDIWKERWDVKEKSL